MLSRFTKSDSDEVMSCRSTRSASWRSRSGGRRSGEIEVHQGAVGRVADIDRGAGLIGQESGGTRSAMSVGWRVNWPVTD